MTDGVVLTFLSGNSLGCCRSARARGRRGAGACEGLVLFFAGMGELDGLEGGRRRRNDYRCLPCWDVHFALGGGRKVGREINKPCIA